MRRARHGGRERGWQEEEEAGDKGGGMLGDVLG